MNSFIKYYFKDRLVLAVKHLKLFLFPSKPIILIFTMGKVGSLSIYSSLKKKMWKHAVFHIHTLDNEEVLYQYKQLKEKKQLPDSRNPIPLLNKYLSKRKVKIITLVRDPIERNISAFFDAFEFLAGTKEEDYSGNIEDLEQIYHKTFFHEYPLNWFQNQFHKGSGIDIFKHTFSIQEGYDFIENNNTSVLLLRSDLENSKKERIIGEFCAVDCFQIKNTNVNSRDLYFEFKNGMKFSKDYLEEIYNSYWAFHFFSEEERTQAIKKWVKKEL